MLYVANDGRVLFGVRTRPEGTGYTIATRPAPIQSTTGLNDGQWHHVVGTLASDGMRLYVDGAQVATRTDVNSGHGYYGYWRVGADTLSGWTERAELDAPQRRHRRGGRVLPRRSTAAQIANHWNLSGHGSGNVAPTAAFTSTANGLTADFDATDV